MEETTVSNSPQFATDSNGKPTTATLTLETYVKLLIRANITDQALWPPGFQQGAPALARVRQIESRAAVQGGGFDWEKLPPAVQDEYDTLCLLLDRLLDDGEPADWEEYKMKREETLG